MVHDTYTLRANVITSDEMTTTSSSQPSSTKLLEISLSTIAPKSFSALSLSSPKSRGFDMITQSLPIGIFLSLPLDAETRIGQLA
mmetsp:Transcript_38115/g.91965  ORF Transcript_38115/g.91965 Transcript_38115/m.91965 type:complete len:85 (-) Transcript_38115:638-892(-)